MDVHQALDELLQDVERLREGTKRQRAFARRREAQVLAIREALAESARLATEAARQAEAAQAQAQEAAQRTSLYRGWLRLLGHRTEVVDSLPGYEAEQLPEALRLTAPMRLGRGADLKATSRLARERLAIQALAYCSQRALLQRQGHDPGLLTWFHDVHLKA